MCKYRKRNMIRKKQTSLNNIRGNQCVLVVRAIVSSIETLLGPTKSLKCCVLNGTSVTSSCTSKIIEHMDIEHPVGFIINDVCQSFHKQFGCGCTTLICLIGYWTKHMQDLVEMGIPVPVITAIIDKAIQEFEGVFKRSSISLKSFRIRPYVTDDSLASSTLHDVQQRDKYMVQENKTEKRQQKLNESVIPKNNDDVSWFFNSVENYNKTENINLGKNCGERNLGNVHKKKQKLQKYILNENFQSINITCDQRKEDYKVPRYEHNLSNHNMGTGTHDSCMINSVCCEFQKPNDISRNFDDCFEKVMEEVDRFELKDASPSTKKIMVNTVGTNAPQNTTTSSGLQLNPLRTTSYKPNVRVLSRHLMEDKKPLTRTEFHNSTVPVTNADKKPSRTGLRKSIVAVKDRELLLKTERRNSIEDVTNNDSSEVLKQRKHRNGDGYFYKSETNNVDNSVDKGSRFANEKDNNLKFATITNRNSIVRFDDRERQNLDIFSVQARNLAHGKDDEMKFVLDIFKKQNTPLDNGEEFLLISDYVAVQTVIGPPSCNSCILDGVVVQLSKENQLILRRNINPRYIMLVNGDITFKYSHAGFKPPLETTRVLNKEGFSQPCLSERHEWINKVKLTVEDLNVGLVVSRGVVDSDLCDCLQDFHGVVVVENICHKQLKMFSKMTNTPIMSYPVDMEIHDLGEPVVIKLMTSGLSMGQPRDEHGVPSTTFAQVCLPDDDVRKANHVVQTLLLCGPVRDLIIDSELKFWNCMNRLYNALSDDQVVPGGGEIERQCINHLEKVKDSRNDPCTVDHFCFPWLVEDHVMFQPFIYEAITAGLRDFLSQIELNAARNVPDFTQRRSSNFANTERTFDNYVCKIEGWKRALRIVKLLLCSEYQITTGI